MNKELIGMVSPSFSFTVTKEKIFELVESIGEVNPIYRDPLAAIEEGYRDIVAPPTFLTLVGHWTGVLYKLLEEIGVDFSRVLHGEEEYEYIEDIYPGDILTGQFKIVSSEAKESNLGPVELVNIETIYRNQKGKEVSRGKSKTLIKKSSGGVIIE